MQAIILAAGMGKRLKDLTNNSAKCMIKVDGITLIERMLLQLDKLNLSEIIIVVGYKAEKLISFISKLEVETPMTFVNNEIYYKTNNIYSLYLAKDYLLSEDTLLLESDLIFDDAALQNIINDKYPNLALVSKYESWMDGTVITLDEDKNIVSFVGKTEYDYDEANEYYKTVNIYKFSKEFSNTHYVPFLGAYIKSQGTNAYYEQVLKVIGLLDKPDIKATMLENVVWYEIDDEQDLDIAESLFTASPKDKLIKIQNRYGGYWRYTNLMDFCYLVNPFYPPIRMVKEIKFNFERLIYNYPSGIGVNSLLAAKCFGLQSEHICVGNGAAELISSLMKTLKGKIGIIRPTFEEYPNRMDEDSVVAFYPDNQDFSYTIDDLRAYYDDKDISTLLLINPDNPSGNFIELVDVLILAKWAIKKGIRLIVDESFVDFANSEFSTTLLSEKILRDYKELVVVKSISKSYGIPGLRLGIICSGDTEMIQIIKEDVSIWNINSIAEFYMQISEKYSEEYKYSLELIKEAREEFIDELGESKYLRVIPTQANYVMCEILSKYSATQLTESLLVNYNIFIKDLSVKLGIKGQYIRIAVKRKKENEILVGALNELFCDK